VQVPDRRVAEAGIFAVPGILPLISVQQIFLESRWQETSTSQSAFFAHIAQNIHSRWKLSFVSEHLGKPDPYSHANFCQSMRLNE
jgi:hypothetical protein